MLIKTMKNNTFLYREVPCITMHLKDNMNAMCVDKNINKS